MARFIRFLVFLTILPAFCIGTPIMSIMTELTLCADAIFPPDGPFTSCEDQSIITRIFCCDTTINIRDSIFIPSSDSTVEYYDSSTSTWLPAAYQDPSPWGTYWVHLDTDVVDWIWSTLPARTFNGDWFRVLIESDCTEIDTAYIRIQVDNQGTIYANGTYIDTTHGNPGSGSTGWRMLHEFDLTPHFHGGVDTLEIMGWNAGGGAGILFELIVICNYDVSCCDIDEESIIYSVNGIEYSIFDDELSWDGDSLLTFTPTEASLFEDGDEVTACLEHVTDLCMAVLDEIACVNFTVDLSPPLIWNFEPPPDFTGTDIRPLFSWSLIDSLSGLDTSSIVFTVDGIEESPTVYWDDTLWRMEWEPPFDLIRGDTLWLCIFAADSAVLCEANILDTCWYYVPMPCIPLHVWIECPYPCGQWTSCSEQSLIFGISDTAGVGLDTSRAYFTIVNTHIVGVVDSLSVSLPSPHIAFDLEADTTISFLWSYLDGDNVRIRLDSLFSADGCKTVPY